MQLLPVLLLLLLLTVELRPLPSRRTLQGRPLMTMKPFLRMVPAAWGNVWEAPDSVCSKDS